MALREKLRLSIGRAKVAEKSAYSGFRERNRSMIHEEVEVFKEEIKRELRSAFGEDYPSAFREQQKKIEKLQEEVEKLKAR